MSTWPHSSSISAMNFKSSPLVQQPKSQSVYVRISDRVAITPPFLSVSFTFASFAITIARIIFSTTCSLPFSKIARVTLPVFFFPSSSSNLKEKSLCISSIGKPYSSDII